MDTPDIGDLFEYDGRGFRVSGWLKPSPNPRPSSRKVGPDRCPLTFCSREEAVYVSGSGVCGVIRRVADVQVTGRVDWAPETFDQERDSHARLVGQEIF